MPRFAPLVVVLRLVGLPPGEHRGEHRASIRVTPDASDPRSHAESLWLRGCRWAVLASNLPFATFLATRLAGAEKIEDGKPLSGAFRNGPAWIRTRDQRIMSPLL